ncbi:uncharacterized protein LOC122316735 [Carya illinoinensis]|nr:uncharacterized protein LOC122316735 [Carya illinoinensis]
MPAFIYIPNLSTSFNPSPASLSISLSLALSTTVVCFLSKRERKAKKTAPTMGGVISASTYKRLRGYWKRRGYERLSGSTGQRRRTRAEQLGSSRGRSRFWRIKVTPKLRVLRVPSPKSFFVRLRDLYVNLMLRFANSPLCSAGAGYGGAVSWDGIGGIPGRSLKEYDEKVIVEIYKSMVMAQGLVPLDAAKLFSQRFVEHVRRRHGRKLHQ